MTRIGDFEKLDTEKPRFSYRGIAVELDGEVVGMAAIYHSDPKQMISRVAEPLRKYPKVILQTAKLLKKLAATYEDDYMIAFADKREKTSDRLLQHLGFEFSRETQFGRMYICRGLNRS